MTDLSEADTLASRDAEISEDDERTISDLLVEQVEFANVIVISKTDLVDDVVADEVEATVRGLNPGARVIRAIDGAIDLGEILDTGRFDMDEAQRSAAWVQELMGEHTPETEEYGISSFVFTARRPFHPQRFWDYLHDGNWTGVIRSKGFFWLATRPSHVYLWSQAGGACSFDVTGTWWAAVPRDQWPVDPETLAAIEDKWDQRFGDRRQQLVFIGRGMDQEGIRAAMERCLCTEEEIRGDSASWTALPDPFPAAAGVGGHVGHAHT
jgi:G3E family GTPase